MVPLVDRDPDGPCLMATRKRDLRPDAKGRYRPYVGWYEGRYRNEE